jgi:hypothetical protein
MELSGNLCMLVQLSKWVSRPYKIASYDVTSHHTQFRLDFFPIAGGTSLTLKEQGNLVRTSFVSLTLNHP